MTIKSMLMKSVLMMSARVLLLKDSQPQEIYG